MKTAIQKFNALNGRTVTRKELLEIKELATSQDQKEVVKRIDELLQSHPKKWFSVKADTFQIQLKAKVKSSTPGNNKKNTVVDRNAKKRDAGVKGLGTTQDELFGLEHIEFPHLGLNVVGLGKAVSADDIYQYVTDLVINTIETIGELPWQKSWKKSSLSKGKEATNYESKKGYRGINYFLLNFEVKKDKGGKGYLTMKNWANPYFLTFKQIQKNKGKIKKGASPYRVFYFTRLFGHTEKLQDGSKLEFYSYDQKKFKGWVNANKHRLKILKSKAWTVERLSRSYIPILKYYNIFNAEDITGIKWDKYNTNENATKNEVDKLAIGEAIVGSYPNPPKIIFAGDQPHYQPGTDTVVQTPIVEFKNAQSYYSTLFHELVHSTGAKKRLNRTFGQTKRSALYAKEELVAEMGAIFLCAESGILFETLNNSAAYLKGWNSRLVGHLKKDNRFFFRAASKAQEAADHILNLDKNGKPNYLKTVSLSVKAENQKSTSQKKSRSRNNKKVVTAGRKRTRPKQKIGLSQPIVLDAGTSLTPVQPKRAAHNGDAAASVLEIPVISKEVITIPQVPDIPTKKPLPAHVKPKSKKVLSSGDLMNMHFESLDFDGAWAEFMQNPAKNMRLAIKGKPKNGKTSGSTTFANYLTRFGNVLYNFVDQGFNKSTKDIWQLAGLADNPRAFASDIDNLEELEREIATGNYQFVFIDMINDYIDKSGIGPQEFKDRFIKKYNDVSFILVFEVTKSGDFKGNQKWTHLVDAIVDVDNFVMYNKGRYGMGHFVIWPEGLKRLDPKKYAELIGNEKEQEASCPTVLF